MLGKAVPQWSVPRLVFTIVSRLSSRLRYKVDKLLGDPAKAKQVLGWTAKRKFSDLVTEMVKADQKILGN